LHYYAAWANAQRLNS